MLPWGSMVLRAMHRWPRWLLCSIHGFRYVDYIQYPQILLSTIICYILFLITNNKSELCIYGMPQVWFLSVLLQVPHVMYLISWSIKWVLIWYIYRLVLLRHSYFTSPDHLVFLGWIRATLQHPTNILLAGPNIHCSLKFFAWVVKYLHASNSIIPFIKLQLLWMSCIILLSPHF